MKSLGRLAAVLLVVIVAFVAIALIGVNLYVQSQGTQARIQQEISQRLGTPLRIRSASVTPWSGLTLTGITIPQSSSVISGDFLDAKSFHLHVSLTALFSRQLVIKKVALLSPNVVWPQNADGKWRLPGGRKEERPSEAVAQTTAAPVKPEERPTTSPPAVPPASTTPPPSAGTTIGRAESGAGKTNNHFVPEVRKVNLTSGSFRFLDRSGNMVAMFEGVDFYSTFRSATALRGTARIAKVSIRDRFFLQQFQSPLRYDPNQLDVSDIFARVGSGDIIGQFTMQPQAKDSPFSVSVKFRNVQADELIAEAGGPKGVVQGKLDGSFQAIGKTADPAALNGIGDIVLHNGQVQQYSLLVALGQILQIEELTQLHLEQAEAKYHIDSGLVTIDPLVLRSPNIRLSATGTVALNGKLRLDSQLAINEKIRSQLFKPIRDNFRPTAEAGYSAVDFQVGGTVDRPKSNLMEKIVGRDLKDFVSGFFGSGKTERPKKKKSADAANPAETISPAPPSGVPADAATPAP